MNTNNDLSIVILAAGKGTRMKSSMAKVLHKVFFSPMLHHVLNATKPLGAQRTAVIVGHQEEAVKKSLQGFDIITVRQEQQLGTGHAVLMTEDTIPEEGGDVMVLCGDTPLIQADSLMKMIDLHRENDAAVTLMTTILENPFGYGRIIQQDGQVQCIVEEKDAPPVQKDIKEVNAGIYLVKRHHLFEALKNITPDNSQGEFYLTDIVGYSVNQNLTVVNCINHSPDEVLGVNSRVELEKAHNELRRRRNIELMERGISLHSSQSISVSPLATVGKDTLIMENVQILGNSRLGEECEIGSGAILTNCKLGRNVRVGPYAVLANVEIGDDENIEPFTLMK